MNKQFLAVMMAAIASQAFAIKGTVVTATDSVSGEITYSRRAKIYEVQSKKMKQEIPLADVVKLEIPKPAGLKDDASPAALQKIVDEYYMLYWDKPATRMLANALIRDGQASKALDVCQKVINEDKSAAFKGEIAPAYWTALMKTGKTDRLENCLNKAATSGDRATSAAALIMRGDMIVDAGGDKPDALKKALRDGYLRVALMYADCPDQKREALGKAAACFDKMGQASRAEKLRQQAQ